MPAYLQTAQDRAAKEVVDELTSFRQSATPNLPAAYAVAAIPVRYALERRDWPAAAALSEPAIGFPLERFPGAEAMIAYARALGDARTGNIAGAEAQIDRLQSLEDKLKGNDTYWANQVEVQRLAASGILAHVRGDDKRAVALVRAAADLDATMDKHPGHPVVGAAGARAIGRSVARTRPAGGGPGRVPGDVEHRSQSLPQPSRRGPRQKQTGDSATAHDAYRKLVALSKSVGPARPGL